MFELFDPTQEVGIHEGAALPHWNQHGVTYFVTFRTEDSVPQALVKVWHRDRDEWLRTHGFDPCQGRWKELLAKEPALNDEFHDRFTRRFMEYLDRGLGACVLREPELAQLVAKSLRHFDGDRYILGDFVIMPNHVHLLVCLRGTTAIESQCYSWKKYSAGEINRYLKRKGRFWQEESFDHLVRSGEQFEHLKHYIAQNPAKAGLRVGEYLHYVRAES